MAAKPKPKPAPAEDTGGRFEIDGEVLEFDLDHITFAEGEEIEAYFDKALHEIDVESVRGIMFIAYLAMKRKRPATTLDEVRRLDISALQPVEGKRPTEEVSETNGSPSSPTS